MNKLNQLKNFINEHGIEARIINNKLEALEVYFKNGNEFQEWVTLEPNLNSIKVWLGY